MCLPLLIFPCTIKSRSSLLAPAHPGGPGNRAIKRLWCGGSGIKSYGFQAIRVSINICVCMEDGKLSQLQHGSKGVQPIAKALKQADSEIPSIFLLPRVGSGAVSG